MDIKRSERTRKLWEDPSFRRKMSGRVPGNKIPEKSLIELSCLFCQIKFRVVPSRNSRKFCSKECADSFKRNRPNLKNRGKTPSQRAGSGISGKYKGQFFRSLYELSFIVNFLERNDLSGSYECFKIPLSEGHHYIPDFVSENTKTIYEIKFEKALQDPKIIEKIDHGKRWAHENQYSFQIFTEKNFDILSFDEITDLHATGNLIFNQKKNGGVWYKRLMKRISK